MAKQSKEKSLTAADFLPEKLNLASLRRTAAECRGCRLYEDATQTVFGAGPAKADLVLVGEQPGNDEDLAGKPFVGPAGRLLAEMLEEAGVEQERTYVTNAVKHFKFEQRGKRRLHKKPSRTEVVSCRPWLESELLVIKPRVVVCLGATAAMSLFGPSFRITRERGQPQPTEWCDQTLATYHPSAVLRMPDRESRAENRRIVVEDLRLAAELMDE